MCDQHMSQQPAREQYIVYFFAQHVCQMYVNSILHSDGRCNSVLAILYVNTTTKML